MFDKFLKKLAMVINKYYFIIFIIFLFFVAQIIVNLIPLDTDMFYHIKLGDIIFHQGIIHHDVLSQASTRYWAPPEWLFQVIIYGFTTLFGFDSFRIFVVICAVLQVLAIFFLLRRVLNVNKFLSIYLSFFYLFITSNQFVGRPQIIVNIFLIVEIYFLLLYVLKNKNLLYLLLPITYLWTNMNGSVVLSPLLCFAYFLICFITVLIFKKSDVSLLRKARILLIYSIGTGIMTILPPQELVSYQQDLEVLHTKALVENFIVEWAPVYSSIGDFVFYTLVIGIPLFTALYFAFKNKLITKLTWTIPLILLLFFGYSAQRDTIYGYISITIIMGVLFSHWDLKHYSRLIKIVIYCCMIAVFGIEIWAFQLRINDSHPNYFPGNAANFIQKEHIHGNMFNQYNYGGYLGYRLYPNYKIFIDGRTELFYCCELPDYYTLTNMNLPDYQYDKLINQVFGKYNISYVVLVTEKDNLGIKLASTLLNDPKWNLVFWDDTSEIYVKNNEENNALLSEFTARAAIPLSSSGYRKGLMSEAFNDYERMAQIQDSALTRNQMGVILFNQGKIHQAADQYNKAIQLNKSYAYAYFNLAEIRITQGNYQDAIPLLKQALILAPNQELIYIQLWKSYLALADSQDAISILKQGYNNVPNDQQKQLFNQLIQKTQASYSSIP